MVSPSTNKLRPLLGLMAGAAALTATAAGAQAPMYQEDPGTALTRHLRSLSDNPRSLHALMGAAQAALKLGDPQAAVTFFARAEEIAPRDPRIKAGFGSAFVQMEQARPALKFFSDAAGLGIPEGEIAGDRGLAYDLVGDPARAQADYRLALRSRNDPEIERRLALSLAIGGDKDGALAAIDGQLRRQDRAAWRTRAFILALSGDAAGATQAVQGVMPGQAAAMQPFLAQLAGLDAAGRAMAVHFGHIPTGGRSAPAAQPTQYASLSPSLTTQAGRPDPGQNALGARTPVAEPATTAARRRPGDAASGGTVEAAARVPAPARSTVTASVRPRPRRQSGMPLMAPSPQDRPRAGSPKAADKEPEPARPAPARLTATAPPQAAPLQVAPPQAASPHAAPVVAVPSPSVSAPSAAASERFGPPRPDDLPAASAPTPAPAPQATPGPSPSSAIATVALPASTLPPPAPEPELESEAPQPAAPAVRRPLAFAEVVEAIRALPGETGGARTVSAVSAPPPEPKPKIEAPRIAAVVSAPAPKAEPESKAEAPAAEAGADAASRHWVQIASAPDSLANHEYRRLKIKHPKLLSDKPGYRTPMGKSNRVLVGPFDSADEAKSFVGQLKKASLTAIAWTSPAGQEIDKIPAK